MMSVHSNLGVRGKGYALTDKSQRDSERLGLFISVGSGIGATLGVLLGGGPGLAIGVGIGAVLGVVADAIVKRSK